MPKPSEQAKAAFSKLAPGEPAVNLRPMFGNLAAFVNGNMFAGLFGDGLFVRLPDSEATVIMKAGGKPFEPVAGHAMTGYVMVRADWQKHPEHVRVHIARALELTRRMPAKAAKAAKKPAAKAKR